MTPLIVARAIKSTRVHLNWDFRDRPQRRGGKREKERGRRGAETEGEKERSRRERVRLTFKLTPIQNRKKTPASAKRTSVDAALRRNQFAGEVRKRCSSPRLSSRRKRVSLVCLENLPRARVKIIHKGRTRRRRDTRRGPSVFLINASLID